MLDDLRRRPRSVVYDAMPATPQQRWPLLDGALRNRCVGEAREPDARRRVQGERRARLLRPPSLDAGSDGARRRRRHARQSWPVRGIRGAPLCDPCRGCRPARKLAGKNRAMRALGAELIESGHDFQARSKPLRRIAADRGWHMVPSFDPLLVRGVASYALELFRAVPGLDTLYVPIGLGSGICGAIAARDALACRRRSSASSRQPPRRTRDRWQLGHAVSHDATTRIADGMACRTPVPEALSLIRAGAERVVEVTDDEIEEAMRALFEDTHNVVEGAGAAALAARDQGSRPRLRGRTVAIVRVGRQYRLGTVRPHPGGGPEQRRR